MVKVYILHENEAWLQPTRDALDALNVPYEEWFFHPGHTTTIDLTKPPPEGIFFNRVSPSSQKRGHAVAIPFVTSILQWLELHGRTVVGGTRPFSLETSKIRQHTALQYIDVPRPNAYMAAGENGLLDLVARLAADDAANGTLSSSRRLVLKPDCGGSGMGVRVLDDANALAAHVKSPQFLASADGMYIVEEHVPTTGPECLYRLEFVDGKFLYALRVAVTTSDLDNCPADACAGNGSAVDSNCPLASGEEADAKFKVLPEFDYPIVKILENAITHLGIGVAGVEVIERSPGDFVVIDCNCVNTNYNLRAEARAKIPMAGANAVARMLKQKVDALNAKAKVESSTSIAVAAALAKWTEMGFKGLVARVHA